MIFFFIFVSIIIIFYVVTILELADDAVVNGVSFSVVLNYATHTMVDVLSQILPIDSLDNSFTYFFNNE